MGAATKRAAINAAINATPERQRFAKRLRIDLAWLEAERPGKRELIGVIRAWFRAQGVPIEEVKANG